MRVIRCLSMIIKVIDKLRVGSVETENQAPVAIDSHRPESPLFSRQTMKAPSCDVHILLRPGMIQRAQHQTELAGVMRLDARRIAGLEKTLDALVPE